MSDVLAELRARFLQRCVSDLARLRNLSSQGRLASDELKALAHSLAGAAGTFGFPEISACAGRLDDAFADGRQPHRRDIAALEAALDSAIRSSG